MAKRKNRRKEWLAMTGGCLLLAAVALAPYVLKRQKIRMPMRVRQLQVSGLSHFKSLEVKDLLDLKRGDSLFGSWTKTSEEKIRSNPKLEGGTIARSLTGEVFMVVKERKVAALLNLDRLYFVDEQGNILGPAAANEGPAMDLVVLSGPWSGKESRELLASRVRTAMELKRSFVLSGTDEKLISELHYDAAAGWVAYLTGNPARIVVGTDGFPEKASRLKRVMRDFKGREKSLKEIDLDFTDRVVVKLES
jgi:cell division septal protein FtsQ